MNIKNTLTNPEIAESKIGISAILHVSDTSIIRVSELLWHTVLTIHDDIILEAKKDYFKALDAEQAQILLEEINFESFKSKQFETVYYLLECAHFCEDMIDYLYEMWMDVVHIDSGLSSPVIFLKAWNIFYSPNVGTVELKPLETPSILGQQTMYYSYSR